MAYKAPGVTIRNQFEPLANPGAFGNRLLAVIGKVDTSILSKFPTFVQEVQKTIFSQITFNRPYPSLGTVDPKDRIVSVTQGSTSYKGCTSETESGVSLRYASLVRGSTSDGSDEVITNYLYDASYSDIYLIDSNGTSYANTDDYTIVFSSDGDKWKVKVDWSPGGKEPEANTPYYVVCSNESLTGDYAYYYFEEDTNENVILTLIWRNEPSSPLERSIYYTTIRKEFPKNAGIYTTHDQVLQDYGPPLISDNSSIASELSFASHIIFGEGASVVMLVPYDGSTKTFQQALDELLTYEEPTIITAIDNSDPTTPGTNARYIAAHVSDASSDTHKKFRIGLISPYYSTDYVNKYKEASQSLHSRRMSIVAPSELSFILTGTDGLNHEIQTNKYAAIVLGAMMVRPDYDVATSMTRKISRTITKLIPKWDEAYMNLIATSGVTLFTNLHGNIAVRDDITTEPETILTAEPYITCISDDIAKSAIVLLDASLIGQKLIIPSMLNAVNTRITSMLSAKQSTGIITGFGRPIIVVDPTDPRKINVTIPIQPIFASKYIDITFSYVSRL